MPFLRGRPSAAMLVVISFAAPALWGAQASHAGVSLNTIDRHLTYKQDGAQARSTGPIRCTRGERITITVRVSQAATGARARNRWKARCTGETQHWQVRARARGAARFANGTGRVCAVATTRAGRRVTDTRRWCRRVSISAAASASAQSANGVQSSKAHTSTKHGSAVSAWNDFASNLVAANLPPGPQTHTLAIAHIAVHDALNAIDPRYEPYAFGGSAPRASTASAVAAAAHGTLVKLVPQAAMSVDAQYDAALSSVPDGDARDAGIATGRAAAAAILARRSTDDLVAAITKPYTPGPADPGVYQPTAPLNFVLLAGWGELAPFALNSASQFRSPAPASLKSSRYRFDFAEAKAVGSASSTRRTARQTETALFWYDAATKEWNAAARQALADRSADEWRAARALTVLNIALADAVIATFEAKFHFNYWRPITAIRGGDRDGNPATRGDSGWQPLCVTPPFPEYPSTHAATGAAAATSLALELGDRHEFIVASPTGASRTYGRFSAAAYQEGVSRIYCGIHFRAAMNVGFLMGARIAHYVDKNLLRAVDRTHPTNRSFRAPGASASCASPKWRTGASCTATAPGS